MYFVGYFSLKKLVFSLVLQTRETMQSAYNTRKQKRTNRPIVIALRAAYTKVQCEKDENYVRADQDNEGG
jgi:hypothetical protein